MIHLWSSPGIQEGMLYFLKNHCTLAEFNGAIEIHTNSTPSLRLGIARKFYFILFVYIPPLLFLQLTQGGEYIQHTLLVLFSP